MTIALISLFLSSPIPSFRNTPRKVVPCFPPEYEILKVFRESYEGFLKDLLLPLVCSPDRMADCDVRDILEAIKWLEYYNTRVDR